MRIRARPFPALAVFVLYLVVFYGIWIYNGVEYEHISDTANTVAKWYVAPLAGGAVFLVIAVTYLGWWWPVLSEPRRPLPRWLWAAPILMFAVGVLNLFIKEDYGSVTANLIGLLILGSVAVGFCEETATRGVLIVGFRGRFSEPMVWFLSTLLFALLHLPNWVFGAGPSALFQVVLAFMTGSTLYLVRRLSRSLVPAMALHGFWDFSSFLGTTADIFALLTSLVGIVGLASAITLARRERGRHVDQFGVASRQA